MSLESIQARLSSRRYLILCAALITALVTLAGGYLLATYRIEARVLIRPQIPDDRAIRTPSVGFVDLATVNILELRGDTYAEVLRSFPVAERIVAQLGLDKEASGGAGVLPRFGGVQTRAVTLLKLLLFLRKPAYEPTDVQRSIQAVRESINASLIPRSAILKIVVSHRRAHIAVGIAREAANAMVAFSQEENRQAIALVVQSLARDLHDITVRYDQAQTQIQAFRSQRGVLLSLPDEVKKRIDELVKIETTQKSLDPELEASRERLRGLRREVERVPSVVQSSSVVGNNPTVRGLRDQIVALEIKLPLLLVDYTRTHPQVVAVEGQIEKLREVLRREVARIATDETTALNPVHQSLLTSLALEEATLQGLLARKTETDRLVSRFNSELASLTGRQNQWVDLEREVVFWAKQLDTVRAMLENIRTWQTLGLSDIRVLDVSPLPPYPTLRGLPVLLFGVVGLLVGGLGAAVGVLVLSQLSRAVWDRSDIAAPPDTAMLGVVERIPTGQEWRGRANGPRWASYRLLAGKLGLRSATSQRRCIVVTACGPDQGEHLVARALARVCAESGRRTLVVRCGASGTLSRPPSLTEAPAPSPDAPPTRGVSRSPVVNLDTADAAVAELASFLQGTRILYDIVVVAAPPATLPDEIETLSHLSDVDRLLLTVSGGQTKSVELDEARETVRDLWRMPSGIVFIRPR